MNYPSCFYGGEHCLGLPYWLIFTVSGILIIFVIWNFFKYKNKQKENSLSKKTRKEILSLVFILITVGIFVPWIIKNIFN